MCLRSLLTIILYCEPPFRVRHWISLKKIRWNISLRTDFSHDQAMLHLVARTNGEGGSLQE